MQAFRCYGRRGSLIRSFLRSVIGPRRLLKLEGPTLPDPAGIGIGETTGIHHHCGQSSAFNEASAIWVWAL